MLIRNWNSMFRSHLPLFEIADNCELIVEIASLQLLEHHL